MSVGIVAESPVKWYEHTPAKVGINICLAALAGISFKCQGQSLQRIRISKTTAHLLSMVCTISLICFNLGLIFIQKNRQKISQQNKQKINEIIVEAMDRLRSFLFTFNNKLDLSTDTELLEGADSLQIVAHRGPLITTPRHLFARMIETNKLILNLEDKQPILFKNETQEKIESMTNWLFKQVPAGYKLSVKGSVDIDIIEIIPRSDKKILAIRGVGTPLEIKLVKI